MSENLNFKCVIVGDCFSGKSTFVRQFILNEDENKPTMSKHGCPITFSTNVGTVCFYTFDTDGQEAFGGLPDSFYQKSNCAIIMFDVTAPSSFDNVPYWYRKVKAHNANIPIVLCGNKIDIKARKVSIDEIRANCSVKRFKYFEISAKAKTNINEPFFYLIEKLVKRGPVKDFTLIGSEVNMSIASLHKMIKEAKAKNTIQLKTSSAIVPVEKTKTE